jgi:hypothetical protein
MCVIDHDSAGSTGEVTQRLGEKHFAVEALKGRVALKEQHARVAQHGGSGLHLALLTGELDMVWRGVML